MNKLTVLEVNGDQEQFLNQLIETKGENLPAKVDEVLKVFEFTDFKAKAWKVLADKMQRLEDQSEAYHSALRSGQHWGIAALYAQKRMGEITREMPRNRKSFGGSGFHDENPGKVETLMKNGLRPKVYTEAERIASHPEILDRVIEHAKETGEIPTKTQVLNTIRVETMQKKMDERFEKKIKKEVREENRGVADYFDALKEFKAKLEYTIYGAKDGWFSPESINLLSRKHSEVIDLMNELEEIVNER